MIRLVQRKLIIPRGDTGNFSLPVPKEANTGDVAVFTIIDPRTNTKVYEKITEPVEQLITIVFTHNDTVNLPVGRYLWDVKFYVNPSFADEKLVNGDEVDSYYAAYTLPECEVRQTGDDLMTSDDSPSSTLTPESLNIITAAITEATQAKNAAAASADEAQGYVEQITGLSAEAETLPAGASATAAYDAETGILTLGLPRGDAFSIAKTYPTIAAMNANYSSSDTSVGDFVMIVSTIGDPDNAKLYVKGAERFEFVVDMSGANGVGVQSIVKSGTVENVDTYTITYTDGTTTTYNVVNGVDGDEYTVMVQDTQPTQESNKLWIPTQAGVVQEVPTVQEMNAAIAGIQVPVTDVQVNGTSVVTSGVAEIPVADSSNFGAVKINSNNGIDIVNMPAVAALHGTLKIASASDEILKAGASNTRPVVANNEHIAAFYGLAKAAGADMANLSSTTVGVYPEAQKSAISTMFSAPVSVTGTTPTITALSGIQYVCGEVSTLDITLPASGIIDVVFTSGSTPTVLTVTPPTGVTVKWANGFDPTNLEANTVYNIRFTNGNLAAVTKWGGSSGGGNSETWRKICDVTTTEDAGQILVTTDENGNSFTLRKLFVVLSIKRTETSVSTSYVKLLPSATQNIYSDDISYIGLKVPSASGQQNNYTFYTEFMQGLNRWAPFGIGTKGENRNNDSYNQSAQYTCAGWQLPNLSNSVPCTAINLLTMDSNSLGAGTKICVWGVNL